MQQKHLLKRHAELVSASHNQWHSMLCEETLRQVQGDVHFYMQTNIQEQTYPF